MKPIRSDKKLESAARIAAHVFQIKKCRENTLSHICNEGAFGRGDYEYNIVAYSEKDEMCTVLCHAETPGVAYCLIDRIKKELLK